MTDYTLLPSILVNIRSRIKSTILLSLVLSLFLPAMARADIVYGAVSGISPDNLTLVVYKGEVAITSAAIKVIGNNRFEYNLNLPPGTYNIVYNNVSRSIVNYPGTNRVNIDFQ